MASTTVGIRLSLTGAGQTVAGFRQASTGIRSLRTAADATTASVKGLGSGLSTLGEKAAHGIKVGTIAATGLATAVATVGIKTAAANEQAQTAFTNLLGSAEGATAYLGMLRKFAAETPFQLADVQTGAQRLMAMGTQAKDVLPYLTAIGDAVSGMGGGAEQIQQVTLAIGQMTAKGKVQGDEILQLTEGGIPALRILADQYGVTTTAMSDMITAGEVQSSKAVPLLIAGMEKGTKSVKGFAGMMEAQSRTISGRWSNLKDNVTQGLGRSFERLSPTIGMVLDRLNSASPTVFRELDRGLAVVGRNGPRMVGMVTRGLTRAGAVVRHDVLPFLRHLWTGAREAFASFQQGFQRSGATGGDFKSILRDVGEALTPGSPFMRGMNDVAYIIGQVVGLLDRVAAGTHVFGGVLNSVGTVASGVAGIFGAGAAKGGKGGANGGGAVATMTSPWRGARNFGEDSWLTDLAYGRPVRASAANRGDPRVNLSKVAGANAASGQSVRGMLAGYGDQTITVPVSIDGDRVATAVVKSVRRSAARKR